MTLKKIGDGLSYVHSVIIYSFSNKFNTYGMLSLYQAHSVSS
jgi:hypothetical protein